MIIKTGVTLNVIFRSTDFGETLPIADIASDEENLDEKCL